MQFAKMKNNPKVSLRIPSFDGGINTSLLPQNIQSNQAVSISNMWFKDGALQTRPSFKRAHSTAEIIAESTEWQYLDTDVKIGFQKYDKNNNLIGDVESHKYALIFKGDKLQLRKTLDGKVSYEDVLLDFNKPLYERCMQLGRKTNVFFYSGTAKNKKLDIGSTEEYYQVFYTEMRGYITIETKGIAGFDELEGKPIKLFFYLVPVLKDGKVKVSFEVFNTFKDIPEEYQPYYPMAITNYDTGYAEFNEDINLLHDRFRITRDVNNDISKLGTEDYGKTEFVDRGFGRNDPKEPDKPNVLMTADYGNEYRWQVYTTNIPKIGDSSLNGFTIYGKFEFKQFETKNWTREELSEIHLGDRVWAGLYIVNDWKLTGTDSSDHNTYDFTGVTKTVAKATKLVFTRNSDDPDKYDGVFYNAADEIVKPDDIRDENGKLLPYLCSSSKVWAEISGGELKIILPQSTYDYLTVCYYDLMAGYITTTMTTKEEKATCKLMGAYIDSIEYECYTKDHDYDSEGWEQQNQSDLITRNDKKIWYGGTNSGYAGGTRLFVAGHPEFQNVLRWSYVNNSAYFPENNFMYVGRDDEKITALNKQDGYLVIFKEHEIFASDYTYSTDDQSNATIYFPITSVSPYIGCDCPGSIQFVANRLTWLTSDGKVYTLYSENSYSERNVREISQHIENSLKKLSKSELQSAQSADYDNKYFIFIGKKAYIWDYDRNPYYNYTSSEQAQKRLCWYEWDLPYTVENVYAEDNELYIVFENSIGDTWNVRQVVKLCQDESTDDSIRSKDERLPIKAKFQSKLFNFDKAYALKNAERVFLELGNVQKQDDSSNQYHTGDFKVYFYTSDGEEETPAVITNQFSTSEFKTYSIRPHIKRVPDVGFRLESECPIKILSAEIVAEIYGEVK
jgi:hypothetical protein